MVSYLICNIRFGIEQEYTLLQTNVNWPLGWPVGGYPGPQVIIFTIIFRVVFVSIRSVS